MTYEMLIKYFSGNCSEQEKNTIEQWKASSGENNKMFEYYQIIWRNAGDKQTIVPDTEAALHKINQKLGYAGSQPKAGKAIAMKIASFSLKAAAVIAVVLGGYFLFRTLKPSAVEVQMTEILTKAYEKTDIVLPDGSHVWLNSSSRLQYPKEFSGRERRVYLEGEAFFEVSKDPGKPFIIETGHSLTTVLGTQFNVKAGNDGEVVVTVAEGKVALAGKTRASSQAKLVAGEKGILSAKGGAPSVETNNDPNYMAWKTGVIVFKNTPIAKVCQTLSEVYGKTFETTKINESEITFTSTFDNQKLEDVLKIMELSLPVKIDSLKDTIFLLPQK